MQKNSKKQFSRRLLSFALSLLLAVTFLPVTPAFAMASEGSLIGTFSNGTTAYRYYDGLANWVSFFDTSGNKIAELGFTMGAYRGDSKIPSDEYGEIVKDVSIIDDLLVVTTDYYEVETRVHYHDSLGNWVKDGTAADAPSATPAPTTTTPPVEYVNELTASIDWKTIYKTIDTSSYDGTENFALTDLNGDGIPEPIIEVRTTYGGAYSEVPLLPSSKKGPKIANKNPPRRRIQENKKSIKGHQKIFCL